MFSLSISSSVYIYIEASILFSAALIFTYHYLEPTRPTPPPPDHPRAAPQETGEPVRTTNCCVRNTQGNQPAAQYKDWLDQASAQIRSELEKYLPGLQNPPATPTPRRRLPDPDRCITIFIELFPGEPGRYEGDHPRRLEVLVRGTYALEGSSGCRGGEGMEGRVLTLDSRTLGPVEEVEEERDHARELPEHPHNPSTDEYRYDGVSMTPSSSNDSYYSSRSSDGHDGPYENTLYLDEKAAPSVLPLQIKRRKTLVGLSS